MPSRAEPAARPTTLVPVTTMEEMPVLTVEERMSLAASLAAAEARIESGDFIEFDAATFTDRLLHSFLGAKRALKE